VSRWFIGTGTAPTARTATPATSIEAWKKQFADEARGRGVSASTVAALMATTYSSATIAADRGQRSFGLSLDQFLAKRGGSAIVARGRALKQSNAALFASIQQRYRVPSGPLLAIWGMETAFAGTKTLCRLWLLSPMTAVGRPISPSSSTQL